MRRALAAIALTLAAAPVFATESAEYGEAFVGAFTDACVPERLSYAGTTAHAESLGWTAAEPAAHPELDAMVRTMLAALAAEEEIEATFDYRLFGKPVTDVPHYLIVSRSSFTVEPFQEGGEPDVWTYVGCHLYNFDATRPIDPAPVTTFTGKPIAREVDQEGLVSYLWGPPCPLPRTGDTWLTYIDDQSPHKAQTGFSGLMIKFDTSEPDPGENVPATFC